MVRSTSLLLVVVMLLASGRLLACGWECSDELAAPAAACHQESAPLTALHGDAAHACLPEVAEPRVTVAKPATGQSVTAAPLVTAFVTGDRSIARFTDRLHSRHLRCESPHSPAAAVLRI